MPLQALLFIALCGPGTDEMLVRTPGGQVFAELSQNGFTSLAVINDGTYRTAGAKDCLFRLSTAGGRRFLSWDGQVQASWPSN